MKIQLLVNGKLEEKAFENAITEYSSRIAHFLPFDIEVIPDAPQAAIRKNPDKRKAYEAEQIRKRLLPSDRILLLDEKGRLLDSISLAAHCRKVAASGVKRWIWIIGGPYGFDEEIYALAHEKLALSPLTFTHDMARLITCEQIYRSFSIIHNMPYHHV